MVRAILVFCWAPLPYFISHSWEYAFILPLVASALNQFYTLLWLPLTSLAIQQAPEDRKSSAVAQLISATEIASAIGSAGGGIIISNYGYTTGFIIAGIIRLLAVPIMSKIAFDS
jgi:predicted MFS family arabinose efflux permease